MGPLPLLTTISPTFSSSSQPPPPPRRLNSHFVMDCVYFNPWKQQLCKLIFSFIFADNNHYQANTFSRGVWDTRAVSWLIPCSPFKPYQAFLNLIMNTLPENDDFGRTLCNQLLNPEEDDYPEDQSESADSDHLLTDDEEDDEFAAETTTGHSRRPTQYTARDGSVWSTTTPRYDTNNPPPMTLIVPQLRSPAARAAVTPADFLNLFLTPKLMDHIVECTNEEIAIRAEKYKTKQYHTSPTNSVELRTLIGLIVLAGAEKASHRSTKDLWSNIFGPSCYRAVMQINRAEFLLLCLRFDHKSTRGDRMEDKFGHFRQVWASFVSSCREHYEPSSHLTIDETMYGFRGNCGFKTYIPTKPEKFGIKMISLCDARNYYYLNGVPYLGADRPVAATVSMASTGVPPSQPSGSRSRSGQPQAQPSTSRKRLGPKPASAASKKGRRGRSAAAEAEAAAAAAAVAAEEAAAAQATAAAKVAAAAAAATAAEAAAAAEVAEAAATAPEAAASAGSDRLKVLKATKLALEIVEPYIGKKRTVTCDNWFGSTQLAKAFRQRNLHIVCTMRRTRKEVPQAFLSAGAADVEQSKFAFQDGMMLTSFVPKPRRIVLLLSTLHDRPLVDGTTNKPEVILYYNQNKGGVDCFNGMMSLRTTARKTRRWPLRCFFGLLDAACMNAYVLYRKSNEYIPARQVLPRDEFLRRIFTLYVEEYTRLRLQNQNLPTRLKIVIRDFRRHAYNERPETQEAAPQSDEPRGRCAVCKDAGLGQDAKKATQVCTLCSDSICGGHKAKIIICSTCAQ